MNQSRPEVPSDDNPFLSIGELLGRISVAALATAIEEHGIYTWDRFGRFQLATETDKERAFELLEDHHKWESTDPIERPEDPRSPMDQGESSQLISVSAQPKHSDEAFRLGRQAKYDSPECLYLVAKLAFTNSCAITTRILDLLICKT